VNGYLRDFLFPPERARSPVKALSGGERNRLLLARLFTRPANVLVLDEPTNDLDLETLELLESQLVDFPGTLLLVSHDRRFLDNVVTSTLVFETDGRVEEYVGGYEDWVRQASARQVFEPTLVSPKRPAGQSGPAAKANQHAKSDSAKLQATTQPRKLSYKESKELDALPVRIEALEQEQRVLNRRIASADFYKEGAEAIKATLSRAEEIERELLTAYERWHELEERSAATRGLS
jgi:ATP-binding cassette subfamily F protein uup